MTTLLLIIAAVFALVIVLLASPISISYYINTRQPSQGYARFNAFFGLMKFQTRFARENKTQPKTQTKSKHTSPHRQKAKNKWRGIALFKQPDFRQHIINFIKRMLVATHAHDLYLKCRIGLGDPADTGMLWAFMWPASAILQNVQFMTIELEPEFIDAVMEFESHGHFKVIPLQFIALTLIFIFSPRSIQAWRKMQQDY